MLMIKFAQMSALAKVIMYPSRAKYINESSLLVVTSDGFRMAV